MTENNRIEWLDVFKGITILLVVLGHSRSEMNYLSRICVGCHMPIFFFVGGLTLHKYDTFSSSVLVKAKALLYPYMTGSLLTILFYWNDRGSVLRESLRFTGYGVLWFLPTLFTAEIMILLLVENGVCRKFNHIYSSIIYSSIVGYKELYDRL